MKNSTKFIFICLLLVTSACTTISPREMTSSAITETYYRIYLYAIEQKKLPATLDALPLRDNYANRIEDAWGRPLSYIVDAECIIIIGSLGADAKEGGEADNADIIVRYRSKDEAGRFIVADDLWIVDGEIQE